MNTTPARLALLATALLFAAGCGAAAHPEPARFVTGEKVVVEVQGDGLVTSPTGDVQCRAGSKNGCSADFTGNGPSVLSARAMPGWHFAGWEVSNADDRGGADPGFLGAGHNGRVYRAVFVPDAGLGAPIEGSPDYQRARNDKPTFRPLVAVAPLSVTNR